MKKKHNFVFKKINILEKFCWNWWMQFLRTFRKKSCQLQKIFARCAKVLFNFFFKTTPLKCSSGHAQCISDKFSEKIPPVDWNFFVQPPENILRTFSSPKSSFVDTKCSSYILVEKNWEKVWTFFAQCPKEIILLSKKLLSPKCFCGHIECSYDKPSERKKNTKVLSIFAQCPEMEKISVLTEKNFLRLVLWPHRRQFKQLWPKVLPIDLNIFRPLAENEKKYNFFFKMINFLENFCWNW